MRWPGRRRQTAPQGRAGSQGGGPEALAPLVDIHIHLLPGVDDGPSDWIEAVAVARAAAQAGTGEVVATPHHMPGRDGRSPAGRIGALVEQLRRRLQEAGVELVVWPGAEVYPTPELVHSLQAGEVPLLGQPGPARYLLLDTPLDLLPPHFDRLLFEIRLAGVVPILAHPERSRALASDPARVGHYVDQGALVQVTAASLLGEFGPQAQRGAWHLLEQGWAHLLASDGHDPRRRSPASLAAAFRAVETRWGRDVARRLCRDHPMAIARGEPWPS